MVKRLYHSHSCPSRQKAVAKSTNVAWTIWPHCPWLAIIPSPLHYRRTDWAWGGEDISKFWPLDDEGSCAPWPDFLQVRFNEKVPVSAKTCSSSRHYNAYWYESYECIQKYIFQTKKSNGADNRQRSSFLFYQLMSLIKLVLILLGLFFSLFWWFYFFVYCCDIISQSYSITRWCSIFIYWLQINYIKYSHYLVFVS